MEIVIYLCNEFLLYTIRYVNRQNGSKNRQTDHKHMKDRIIQVMEREGMNPSRFAEEIGIQRASMSHITSGRNNPSLDVLMKILERFPNVNADWLLFGKGNMLRSEANLQPDLFTNTADISDGSSDDAKKTLPFGVKNSSNATKPTVIEKVIHVEKESKLITKIMVFYSDNTYDTFVPEKKEKE